ncbi:hypothetical protein D3C71_1311880 [compost metagenome]
MAFWKFRCTFITRLMKCGPSSRPSLISVVASCRMCVGLNTSHSGLIPRAFMPAASSRALLKGVFIRYSRSPNARFKVVASRVHISAPASMPFSRSSHRISQVPGEVSLTMSPCTPPPVELFRTMSQRSRISWFIWR